MGAGADVRGCDSIYLALNDAHVLTLLSSCLSDRLNCDNISNSIPMISDMALEV